jgi:transcriptional regulator with XRE-family HTH domain
MSRDVSTLRKLAAWPQYKLARATGIDRTRLSLAENGHITLSAAEQTAIEKVLLKEIGRRREQFADVLTELSI